jgi:hypothetical protein
MNFWKRVRWIGSGLVLALWLVAVLAGLRAVDGTPSARPPACTTNCFLEPHPNPLTKEPT